LLFLEFGSLLDGSHFRVFVNLGLGGDQGPRTAQDIVSLDADDGLFLTFKFLRV